MNSKVVLLCGYYGYGNGGDEALLATLLQMLPKSVTPIVMSSTPDQTSRQHGVATCHRNRPLEVFQAMLKADTFIWGGGSLIQDATSIASPLYYIGWMTLAQLMGLKTIAWAQGIGPLHHAITKAIARWSFGHCTARTTRDQASSALLNTWNLPHELAPDPVWALSAEAESIGNASKLAINHRCDRPIRQFINQSVNPSRVAVVLRSHPLLTAERLSLLAEALQRFQVAMQIHLVLLPFQRSQDYDIAVRLQSQLPTGTEVVMLEDPRQLKQVFQTVELTIAMRLHALIMAAAEGCRCFGLSYDPKVRQLMTDLDLPGWDLDQLPKDPDTLVKAWSDHLQAENAMNEQVICDRMDRACRHQQVLMQVLLDGYRRP